MRKVLDVPSHKIIGIGGFRTLEKAIIGFIGRLRDRPARSDKKTLLHDKLEKIFDTQRL